eukprot:CAMPEP_0176254730 /NCGR_PEP_ID=MMETSP0121_2-20121125/36681_1 /TAXON_ID=160619 /ORGANISM="Kryptoperidinium foliaceum, Strain CCMP 1326" /LENGTH=86 /DNA_ID=CAMNT_0017594545 /DNA_START=414 /DNA_END=671 /DNA_ORIENTATION=-
MSLGALEPGGQGSTGALEAGGQGSTGALEAGGQGTTRALEAGGQGSWMGTMRNTSSGDSTNPGRPASPSTASPALAPTSAVSVCGG